MQFGIYFPFMYVSSHIIRLNSKLAVKANRFVQRFEQKRHNRRLEDETK